MSSVSLARLWTTYPGEIGIHKAPSTPTTRCRRYNIWKSDGLTTTSNTNHMPCGLPSNDQNQDGWRRYRQRIAWKSCSLATSLSSLFFILALNWTVRNRMLWPHYLVLSTTPQGESLLLSRAVTCQPGRRSETASGKLWLPVLQSHCSRHDLMPLSVSSIWHELGNF